MLGETAESGEGNARGLRLLRASAVLAKGAVLALGLLFVAGYVGVVALRLRYPFELEWMEGGAVDHVRRVLAGGRLYVRPTVEFVPYMYPPLYYYVAAAVSVVTGAGFVPLRLVSFLSSLGCFGLLYRMVRAEGGSRFAAWLAPCLFAATYALSGFWFDLGRVDSLFLVLLLGSLHLLRSGRSRGSAVLAGVLAVLSFLAKQTALGILLPVMLYAVLVQPRRGLWFVGTAVVLGVSSVLLLDALHEGWFRVYIFDLAAQRRLTVRREVILSFWSQDVCGPLGIAFAASLAYLLLECSRRSAARCLFLALLAVGMVGSSWLLRPIVGSYVNVLIPAHAAVALLFGLGVHKVLELVRAAPPGRRWLYETAVCVVCLVQLVGLLYHPRKALPTRADAEVGERLVQVLGRFEGEVYVPAHGYVPTLAGKRTYAHAVAAFDVLRVDGAVADEFRASLAQAFRERRFRAILCDRGAWPMGEDAATGRHLGEHYEQRELIPYDPVAVLHVTRPLWRPELVYVPKGSP